MAHHELGEVKDSWLPPEALTELDLNESLSGHTDAELLTSDRDNSLHLGDGPGQVSPSPGLTFLICTLQVINTPTFTGMF